jgi:hypothetical protein
MSIPPDSWQPKEVVFETNMGTFKVELYWQHAPKTCKNFAELVCQLPQHACSASMSSHDELCWQDAPPRHARALLNWCVCACTNVWPCPRSFLTFDFP